MKCIRCKKETEPYKIVGGYVYGPKCYLKTFGKDEKFVTQSVAERDDRTYDWVDQMKDEK